MGTERRTAGWTAAGTAAAGAVVALVDPSRPGRYPSCPTKLLTGLDCPACGTLRGVHDLAHGHVLAALDHNVLLLLAVPFGAWVWLRWVRTAATGRPARAVRWPAWGARALIALAVVFAVARNVPVASLAWLDAR